MLGGVPDVGEGEDALGDEDAGTVDVVAREVGAQVEGRGEKAC